MLKINLAQTSVQMMYGLLSQDAGKTITSADVSFANLTALATQTGPNASIELSSVPGSTIVKPGGVEPLVRKLTRHTLTDIATELEVALAITDDVSLYAGQPYAVAKLNELLGSVLTEAEVTAASSAVVDGKVTVTYTMAPTAHVAIFGDLELEVTDNVDRRETVDQTFSEEELNGFDAPAKA